MPFEKSSEVQAHSKPVTRMRVTANNTHLFSVGADGLLCIYDIKDRDPKSAENLANQLKFSQEILTKRMDIEQIQQEMESMENKFRSSEEQNNEVEITINNKKQLDTIAEKRNELIREKTNAMNKEQSLRRQIEESINTKEVERKKLIDAEQDAIEQKRNKYSKKMLLAAGRFQTLQTQKEHEKKIFEEAFKKLQQDHLNEIRYAEEEHRKEMEYK